MRRIFFGGVNFRAEMILPNPPSAAAGKVVNQRTQFRTVLPFHFRRISMLLMIFVALCVTVFACSDGNPGDGVINDFETEQDLDRVHWECHALFSLSEEHPTNGSRCLRLELYPSPYPGVTPILRKNDWSEFRSLCFDIYNAEKRDVQIAVRIDDRKTWPDYSNRYNKGFQLSMGTNRIEIPLNTLMTSGTRQGLDLKNIQRFMIFMVNPPEKNVLYIDYIRLMR